MCALYIRCALSVLQKECRKVCVARYTLGARYRSENMVYELAMFFHTIIIKKNNKKFTVCTQV